MLQNYKKMLIVNLKSFFYTNLELKLLIRLIIGLI
jgi:hypothetical protein